MTENAAMNKSEGKQLQMRDDAQKVDSLEESTILLDKDDDCIFQALLQRPITSSSLQKQSNSS